MANSLVKGSGCGTREWREDFKLEDSSGNSVLKIPQTPAGSEVVFNDASQDLDFRVESDGNANAIFVDASTDRVGIFTAAPAVAFDVTGAAAFSSTLAVAGNVAVNTNKFNVTASSGNTTVAGTLGVTGNLTGSAVLLMAGIETGLTAHAGGTQGAALALSASKSVHVVTTVGSANDSVVLPAATGSGAVHYVSNQAAANSMQLFGLASDTINAVASGTGVAVTTKKTAICVDYAAGVWFANIA